MLVCEGPACKSISSGAWGHLWVAADVGAAGRMLVREPGVGYLKEW